MYFAQRIPWFLLLKKILMRLGSLAYLASVSFYTGVDGNERTDALAKEDTFLGITKTQLPLAKSNIKMSFILLSYRLLFYLISLL